MRRSNLATLVMTAATLSILAGCQQTPATPVVGGPLVPLSPNSASSVPTLRPFGGQQTRVTPPPTGAVSIPNNYLGGVAPAGQASLAPLGGGFAAVGTSQPIGSGVRQTGWNQAGAPLPSGNLSGPGPGVGGSGTRNFGGAANPNDPRRGGMQVIDLTNAPQPPGYQGGFAPQQNFGPSQPNFTPQQYYVPPQNLNTQPNGGVIRTIQTPTARQFADAIAPGPSAVVPGPSAVAPGPSAVVAQTPGGNSNSIGNLVPLNAAPLNGNTGVVTAPSTQPINGGVGQSSNLPWRTPGSQF
ncbi:MAG: hypothetical protein MI861_21595 [Pirellulales bacterium]|nr:hypothetical protein [Pirellulales bacterium]